MPVRRSIALLGLAALVVGWAVIATGASIAGVASLVPALLLLAALLLRRYPGEHRIARLRDARVRRGGTSRPSDVAIPLPATVSLTRGGLLLGRRLAVRPPPWRPAHA
jgi:hypothetical protein